MFYGLFLLLVAGLLGIVLTGDMFNLYVFLEISSLAAYALLASGGIRGTVATFRYLIVGTIAATLYLLGTGYLYAPYRHPQHGRHGATPAGGCRYEGLRRRRCADRRRAGDQDGTVPVARLAAGRLYVRSGRGYRFHRRGDGQGQRLRSVPHPLLRDASGGGFRAGPHAAGMGIGRRGIGGFGPGHGTARYPPHAGLFERRPDGLHRSRPGTRYHHGADRRRPAPVQPRRG